MIERRFGTWTIFAITAGLLPLSFYGSSVVIFGSIHSGLLYSFLLGYLVASPGQTSARSSRFATLVLCAALISFYWAHTQGYVLKQWLLLITTISASLIVGALSSERYRNYLQWKPIRLLGSLSYSFYALHGLGLDLGQRFATMLEGTRIAHWLVVVAVFTVTAGAAFLVSIPMHYCVELPAISVRRLFVWAHAQ